MVSIKVDAEAKAKLEGSESLERYPIVAKVKGTGKDGALGVQVSGDGTPIGAKVALDGPVGVAIPELKGVVESLAKIASGIKIEISEKGVPVTVSLGKVPVDLAVSVYSPTNDQVFKVEIKGTIGER